MTPEACRELCRSVAGDAHRDRYVSIHDYRESIAVMSVIPSDWVYSVPLAVLEHVLRTEGAHTTAEYLIATPLDQRPCLAVRGETVGDAIAYRAITLPCGQGGDA